MQRSCVCHDMTEAATAPIYTPPCAGAVLALQPTESAVWPLCTMLPAPRGISIIETQRAEYCRRLQQERKYNPGWCYHHLRARWGEDVLREYGVSVTE